MVREQFKHYALSDTGTLAEYLEAVIEGFRRGSLEISAEGQQLLLRPAGLVTLEIEATRQNALGRLNLKLSWSEDEGGPSAGEPLRLVPGE